MNRRSRPLRTRSAWRGTVSTSRDCSPNTTSAW
ncbi:hypothetical protein ACFYSC_14970 [Streptosporangium sp. NPDC004379]